MKQIFVNGYGTRYYITKDGKCYNSESGKYLKGQIIWSGYRSYNLTLPQGNKKRFYAHRLVAIYYLNNGKELEDWQEVNHIDGNKDNNNVSNLEICSHSQNMKHAIKNNLIPPNYIYCFDKDLNLLKTYKHISDVEKDGFSVGVINQELFAKKKKLTYGKYFWSRSNSLSKNDIILFKNRGIAKEVQQFSKNGKFIAKYKSTGEAGRKCFPQYKRASNHIGECCRGRIPSYKGFIWRYSNDIV